MKRNAATAAAAAQQKNSFKSKKKSHLDQHYDMTKCDKQTQITTLLCSKFKYTNGRHLGNGNGENGNFGGGSGGGNGIASMYGLSASMSSIPESVVSIIDDADEIGQRKSRSSGDQMMNLVRTDVNTRKKSIEVYRKGEEPVLLTDENNQKSSGEFINENENGTKTMAARRNRFTAETTTNLASSAKLVYPRK